MTIRKSIEFFAPYVAETFNQQVRDLVGDNGLLSGSVASSTATSVTPGPYSFIQNGLIVSEDANSSAVTVPDYSVYQGPVYITLSSPDATDASGVTITAVQGDEDIAETTVVLAARIANAWAVPSKMSVGELHSQLLQARADASQGPVGSLDVLFREDNGIRIGAGDVDEADGSRRSLVADNTNYDGYAAQFDVDHVDPDFYRTNHIVLRKSKDYPSASSRLIWAKGDTFENGFYYPNNSVPVEVSVNTTSGNNYPSVADNAAGEHIVAWGNGTNLRLSTLAHTSSRTPGSVQSFAAGGVAAQDVQIVAPPDIVTGDRLYGIYADGNEIVLFRTVADGTSYHARHVLTSFTNTCQKPQMVIDANRNAHIVFQHDEAGGSNNQIYYAKYNLEGGDWGTLSAFAVQPRFARGSNHGQNDTAPSIGIDNSGNVHIAFVRATGSAVVGDIVYLVIDQAGVTVEAELSISGGSAVNDGTGIALTTDLTDNAQPSVTVTPQGDVYVGFVRKQSATFSELCAFERTLYSRTGFRSVRYHTLYDATSASATWHKVFSDELGRLCALAAVTRSGDNVYRFFKFTPVICSDSRTILPDILSTDLLGDQYMGLAESGTVNGFTASQCDGGMDRDGGIQMVDIASNQIWHRRVSSQVYVGTDAAVDKGVRHPKDVYLASFTTPSSTASAIPEERCIAMPNADKMPFKIVGHNGEFGGFFGLQQAANTLKGIGGKIIVNGGYHKVLPVWLPSGVELVSNGHAVLDFVNILQGTGQAAVNVAGYSATITTVDSTKNIFGVELLLAKGVRPGDVVYLYDSTATTPLNYKTDFATKTYVIRVIDDDNFVLQDNVASTVSSLGANARALIMPVGNRIEGVTITSSGLSGKCFVITQAYRPAIKDVTCDINTMPQIRLDGNFGCRLDGVICPIVTSSNVLEILSTLAVDYATDVNGSCRFEGKIDAQDYPPERAQLVDGHGGTLTEFRSRAMSFSDDFVYKGSNWITDGVPQPDDTPHPYIAVSNASTGLQIKPEMEDTDDSSALGVLRFTTGGNGADEVMYVATQYILRADFAAKEKVIFAARFNVPNITDVTDDCIYDIGICGYDTGSGESYYMLIKYNPAVNANWCLYIDDAVSRAGAGDTVVPLIPIVPGTPVSAYIEVSNTSVRAWMTGLNSPEVVALTGSNHGTLTKENRFRMRAQCFETSSGATQKEFDLDYWEAYVTDLISG